MKVIRFFPCILSLFYVDIMTQPNPLEAAVRVANPGFEEEFIPGPSGCLGPVPGWLQLQGFDRIGVAYRGSTYAMYNNGLEPQGRQMAFLWHGELSENNLAQTVTGFQAGKTYIVSFACNARAHLLNLGAPAATYPVEEIVSLIKLTVSLGETVIKSGLDVKPVEVENSFSKPFHQVVCAPFTPTTSGSFDLVFKTVPLIHQNYATLMLDDVRIRLKDNEPPVFAGLTSVVRTYAGIAARATLTADDEQHQTLTYRLKKAPAGAVIDSASGQFSWTPTAAQLGVHEVVVEGADDGTPSLVSETKFSIEAVALPSLTILQLEDIFEVNWTGLSNVDFQVERTPFLEDPDWQTVSVVPSNSEGVYSWKDEGDPIPVGYYRLRLLPR